MGNESLDLGRLADIPDRFGGLTLTSQKEQSNEKDEGGT